MSPSLEVQRPIYLILVTIVNQIFRTIFAQIYGEIAPKQDWSHFFNFDFVLMKKDVIRLKKS